ncbi:M1 family metallopeptidase [Amycolatopsis suaedae]|uniref:Aminopeptidase N n=1 Tax=Amycolatopsis suaedae TaxID=2510978 RepID=A0A4Q7JB90_9PSEU|nr:M1 family metallopeptidase [Amycolatopsis suaedae]RZQ64276.1 M1 family peptidase [Amycolatopsis suaedae]
MRRSTRAGTTALAAGMATVLLATSASAAPAPGAPGVGDPYYPGAGNGGYDVSHYWIDLTYDPATDRLSGSTTIDATATQELSSFNLDFGLDVSVVTVGGHPATFVNDAKDPSEVIVTPARPIPDGDRMRVVVTYSGIPSQVKVDGRTAWTRTPSGGLSVNQPRAAEWWFPSNDHPSDKATYNVSVAVPDGTSALSNGKLLGRYPQRPGWTTWSWLSSQPQASYLAFIALGDFEVHEQTSPRGLPFVTAYDRALGAQLPIAKQHIETTPRVTDFLASKFGPYPFSELGGVATSGFGYAIENQTRSVYGTSFWSNPDPAWVVAHEVAHQWFGDSVSVATWREMWLNEGFATYAEWLWSEQRGKGTADELAQAFYQKYPTEDPFWQVVVSDPGNIFAPAVYERGAMALHALRKAVGDKAFFAILGGWHLRKKGTHATIAEFTEHAERVSGKQLDEVFATWIHSKGKPATSPNGPGVATVAAPASFAAMERLHEEFAAHGHGH